MRFKGSSAFEDFWSLLENESSRGLAIVVAAHFDEKLASLLGKKRGDFSTRIMLALAARLLSQNEHDDLHVIRELRNSFAHDLRASTFDTAKTQQVDTLKTWQVAVTNLPQYADLFQSPRERLLYVAGAFFCRLNQRHSRAKVPLPEPPLHDISAWPLVTDR